MKKLDAMLRRLCKKHPRKGLEVPESVHNMWKKGANSRRELKKVLLECGMDKVGPPNQVMRVYMCGSILLALSAGCVQGACGPHLPAKEKQRIQDEIWLLHGPDDEGRSQVCRATSLKTYL